MGVMAGSLGWDAKVCNPKMDQYSHHWHKVQSTLELEALSTGLGKDMYWFYHLLTVLPSYFVGLFLLGSW